jgi:hypothetical protein
VSLEVEHGDRHRALDTRSAPGHEQQNVRGARRHSGRDHPTGEWIDHAEEPHGNPLSEVTLIARPIV